MQLTPNLVIAALGPFAELLGVLVLVALFTLLRSQSDRRPYFKAWEESWVMLAVSLTAGVIYERLVDPTSVFYPASPFATWLFAVAHIGFRLLALALVLRGARLIVRGTRDAWTVRAAVPVAAVLSLLADTRATPLGALTLVWGPFAMVAYGWATGLFTTLPPSRRNAGTRLARYAFAGLTALSAGLVWFYAAQRMDPALTTQPWVVRFARYGFYTDLILQLGLAYAMVRLLFDDARREQVDERAHLELLKDRNRLSDLYDAPTGLLGRLAFDRAVGLDFARATFGSVVRLRLANFDAAAAHGPTMGAALMTHFAGVVSSEVRAHDRVYRWTDRELLVVMPRATPAVARSRMEYLIARAAPLALPGVGDALRADAAAAVAPFTGAEDLAEAARRVDGDPRAGASP